MPGLSAYLQNSLLEYIDDTLAPTIYLSLHTGAPGTTGANEVSGGSYARVACAFGAASAGAMTNSGTVTVNVPASTTVTAFGFWDALSGGNFLGGANLSASQTFSSAGTLAFSAGQLTFAMTC